ncbi:MAG: hypothetical protein ACJ788_03500 [Ktedonobacteraceae bacterium]
MKHFGAHFPSARVLNSHIQLHRNEREYLKRWLLHLLALAWEKGERHVHDHEAALELLQRDKRNEFIPSTQEIAEQATNLKIFWHQYGMPDRTTMPIKDNEIYFIRASLHCLMEMQASMSCAFSRRAIDASAKGESP